MKLKWRPLALATLLSLVGSGFADLKVGARVPPLQVACVVKGKAVDLSKGVHVVEFWATWCAPCRTSIPHLSEMARRYKGRVDFTGVSVMEEGNDRLGQVKQFVQKMGARMDYNVSFDGDKKFMATRWMKEARRTTIPSAFLVKDGELLWIGHPMDNLDKTIDQVLAGTFDRDAARARFADEFAERQLQEKQQGELQALIWPAIEAGNRSDVDGIMAALDRAREKITSRQLRKTIAMQRFLSVNPLDSVKGAAIAREISDGDLKGDSGLLNALAWKMIDPDEKEPVKRDYDAAVYVAQRAAEACQMKVGSVLDTYGLALFLSGQKAKAIEIQTLAVRAARAANADSKTVQELSERLAQFRKG